MSSLENKAAPTSVLGLAPHARGGREWPLVSWKRAVWLDPQGVVKNGVRVPGLAYLTPGLWGDSSLGQPQWGQGSAEALPPKSPSRRASSGTLADDTASGRELDSTRLREGGHARLGVPNFG